MGNFVPNRNFYEKSLPWSIIVRSQNEIYWKYILLFFGKTSFYYFSLLCFRNCLELRVVLNWNKKGWNFTGGHFHTFYVLIHLNLTKAMISGVWDVWMKVVNFLKKTWNPLLCIGALPFLPILMLGWVKNVSFWVIQKSMNFEVKWVENIWCSRAFFLAKV